MRMGTVKIHIFIGEIEDIRKIGRNKETESEIGRGLGCEDEDCENSHIYR